MGQGLEALDEGVGGGGRFAGHAGEAEVVDAEVHQDVGQAGYREDVAVEACQRVLADLVPQEAVSGDALVDDPSPVEAPVEEVHGGVEPTPSNQESPNATAIAVSSGANTSTPET